MIRDSVDVYVYPNVLERAIREGEFEIFNRESEGIGLSLEWHGDSPETDIWDITINEWIESRSNTTISIVSNAPLNLERAVWVTADDSGVTIHLSARCPLGGC